MKSKHTEGKIYGVSIAGLIANLLLAPFAGVGTYMIYHSASNDSCISALIGMITSILPLVTLLFIKKWSKDKTILDLNIYLFGNAFGNVLNTILNVTYFISGVVIFYNMVSFFNLHFLPDTSRVYIEILILVVTSYAAIQSSNVMSRLSQIIFMLDLIVLAICPVGLSSNFDLSRLYPVAQNGYAPIIDGSLKYFLMSTFSIFLVTIVPNTEIYSDKNNKLKLIIAYFLGHLCIFLIILLTVIVLGEYLLPIYRFPEYMGLKKFSLFNIIERVENALSLQFLFSMFNFVSMCIHFNMKSISKITRYESNNKNKVIVYTLCVIMLVTTNAIFRSVVQSTKFILNTFPYIVLIGIIVPITITSIGILIKRKKLADNAS